MAHAAESPPGFSVHGTRQARKLEVAAFFSRGIFPDPIEPRPPGIAGDFLTPEPPGLMGEGCTNSEDFQ